MMENALFFDKCISVLKKQICKNDVYMNSIWNVEQRKTDRR